MSNDQISSLSCWKSVIECEPLSGGITNQNFVVPDGDSKFVARICEERRFLGIDRLNEKLCQEAAHAADVAPAVVHFENGILVSEFVEATTFANANLQDSSTLGRVAETIRQLHNARQQLTGELLFFCPF